MSITPGALPAAMPEIVMASLKNETSAIAPGQPFRLGLLLEPKDGWHTYWENPGDAGIPTTLTWTLPKGFSASGVDWPPPVRIAEGPLVIYGYEGRVFLPVTVTPPMDLNPQATYAFHLKAEWLVCKDICIPESTELTLSLPVGDVVAASQAPLFAEHDAKKPVTLAQPFTYTAEERRLTVSVPLGAIGMATPEDIERVVFFPRQINAIRYAAEPSVEVENGTMLLTLARAEGELPAALTGLLQIGGKFFDVVMNAAPVAVPLAETVPAFIAEGMEKTAAAAPPSPLPETEGMLALLLFALLGGVILNLMPCVLPVLSLKALAVVKKSGGAPKQVAKQGVAYTLGILVSFAVIAGLLLSLKAGGEAVGWGFQMQSPAFVGFLIYLLFLIGLNLSGLFDLPVLLGNAGGNDDSMRGSFLTGVLATAVATPCTAPFMASAVGAALLLPEWQAFLIFQALGFGLALPFLLVSFAPRLLKFLPKPGRWMENFKQLLAFPMYASVIWLLWVLTQQTSADGLVVALTGMLAMALLLWMKTWFADGSMAYRLLVAGGLAAVLWLTLPSLDRMEKARMAIPADCAVQDVDTVPYSPQALADLRRRGTPVFMDVTAAWCITCQVNARVAIHTERTMHAFKDRGITLMVADWTRQNPDITAFLTSFGYSGVPLAVYYPPDGGEPKVLPQLLTEDIVINAITP